MFLGCQEHKPLCIYGGISKNLGLGFEALIAKVEAELRYHINSRRQVNNILIETDWCACNRSLPPSIFAAM